MSAEPMILAIDQGTTNTKAILVDRAGIVRGMASRPMDIEFPQPAWVQQDARAIWHSVQEAIDECLEQADSPPLLAVGISNQRESGLAWDAHSGEPIGPVVTWQCRRGAGICDSLRSAGLEDEIRERSGLPIDPMFTGSQDPLAAR